MSVSRPDSKRGQHDLSWLKKVSAFGPSRIILTANNFRIFDHLEKKRLTAAALARIIKTNARATELLLNSLAAIGLLAKKGESFINTPVSSRYLVSGKPDYQGDILRHYNNLWESWSGLDSVVKSGKPNRRARDFQSFILGMHNIALQKVGQVLPALNLKGIKTLLDLGGGPGTYSMEFARKNISVTLFDFPETVRIARRLISGAGLRKMIRLHAGDFTKDEMGSGYDMVFISQILHAYSVEECIAMLKKAHASLNPGGQVVVQEFYIDETRANPLQGAIFAINMLVNTPAGRTYTPKEMGSWLKKAGFTTTSAKLLEETVLVSGKKK